MASLVGSTLISVIAVKFVHVFHAPHQCLAIPSVIPMVPGVLMYRALFALIEMQGVVGELTEAFSNAVKASLIILCIAIGVAIPNIYARRWLMPMRKHKLNQLIAQRREKRIFEGLDPE
ncbi:threonine/serine exporter family protein, partial [uncultured Prevotella sp.]